MILVCVCVVIVCVVCVCVWVYGSASGATKKCIAVICVLACYYHTNYIHEMLLRKSHISPEKIERLHLKHSPESQKVGQPCLSFWAVTCMHVSIFVENLKDNHMI